MEIVVEIVMEIVTSWNRLKQYGCASAGEAMSETYPDSLKATKAQTIVFFIEGAPSTLHTILRGGGGQTLLKWMIWEYHYFWKHPVEVG